MLSSQDQEVHPITPTSRGKKSITESIAVASGQLSEAETLGSSSHSSSAVQASSLVYKNKLYFDHFNEQITTVLLSLVVFLGFFFDFLSLSISFAGQNKLRQSVHGQFHRFGSQLGVALDRIEWAWYSA